MSVRLLGGFDNLIIRRAWLEAGNVLAHRAPEQFDVLGQVADIAAKIFGMPLIEACAIEQNRAAKRRPQTNERAHKR